MKSLNTKCKLCLKEFDSPLRTNSHILPHSLIKRAISYQGSKKRDKEIAFKLSIGSKLEVFVGQSVLPEEIEQVGSVEIDTESQSSKNLFSEDYIFCDFCEKRFGVVENYFSEKIIYKFENLNIFSSNERSISLPSVNNYIIRLYVYSLFWRVSISSKFDQLILQNNQEEQLRNWLDSILRLSIDETIENSFNIIEIPSLPLTIIVSEKLDDPTKGFIFEHPISIKPVDSSNKCNTLVI